MQALLFVDLVSGSVSSSLGGPAFVWPKLVQGDDLTLSLRLTQQISGSAVEVSRVVHGLKATLGRVDTPPADGGLKLKIGTAVTPTIAFNASASQVADALNSLSTLTDPQKPLSVTQRDGSNLIQAVDGLHLNLSVAQNELWPLSFARLREFQFDGGWMLELRLIQAPVAFTDAFARAVPAAPVITEVQQGGSNGSLQWNEVQKLFVPPQFRGNYQIRRGFAKSTLLSTEDGPDEIKAAIASLVDPDGEFIVTNPLPNSAHIEFSGSMAGQSFPLLETVVVDAPEGDLTINLSLDTEELDTLLRGTQPVGGASSPEVKLPFEVEAVLEDEHDSNVLHTVTLIRTELTVQSELTWEELATYPTIDWLRPPLPRDYVPVTQDQIAVGGQHTRVVLGDGAHTAFTVVHNLNEDGLHLTLRENTTGGRQLNAAEDYTVIFNDANSLTVTLSGSTPPASGSLALMISTASRRSVFQAHTHTIGQIVGLQPIIDDLGSRLQTLERVVGITGGAGIARLESPSIIAQWTFARIAELYPVRRGVVVEFSDISKIDRSKLTRIGGLFAAVHDATSEALPVPMPSPADALVGRVFQNNSGHVVTLNPALKHRAVALLPGEFAACDGRAWYRVARPAVDEAFSGFAFSAIPSTDFLSIAAGHGFANGSRVRLTTTGSLPGGVAPATDYFIRDLSGNTAKLAAIAGGPAINLTSTGTGTHKIGLAPMTSWYPTDFERTLFALAVNDAQLQVNFTLALQIGIELAVLNANVKAQWMFVIEHGSIEADSAPARTGLNLAAVNWDPTPILVQRIILSSDPCVHIFGCTIARSIVVVAGVPVDTITTNKIAYGASSGASGPTSANFALRARLIRFDTEDSPAAALGLVALRGLDASGGAESSSNLLGRAIIKSTGS